jgi:phage terminase large subunit-like protein
LSIGAGILPSAAQGRKGPARFPKDALAELVSARGIPDLLDTIKVHHVSGGVSVIGLKTYASGREKFQGETLDLVWFDEEPPADIYTVGLTRTNVGANPVWMTFTPLLGMSEVVRRFLQERSSDRHVVSMTIDDVVHYTEDEKKKIIASYPPHKLEENRAESVACALGPAASLDAALLSRTTSPVIPQAHPTHRVSLRPNNIGVAALSL